MLEILLSLNLERLLSSSKDENLTLNSKCKRWSMIWRGLHTCGWYPCPEITDWDSVVLFHSHDFWLLYWMSFSGGKWSPLNEWRFTTENKVCGSISLRKIHVTGPRFKFLKYFRLIRENVVQQFHHSVNISRSNDDRTLLKIPKYLITDFCDVYCPHCTFCTRKRCDGLSISHSRNMFSYYFMYVSS